MSLEQTIPAVAAPHDRGSRGPRHRGGGAARAPAGAARRPNRAVQLHRGQCLGPDRRHQRGQRGRRVEHDHAGRRQDLHADRGEQHHATAPPGCRSSPAGDNLTIVGNGDTIERSTATGTPAFRLFDVAAGASLSLANLTLQGGRGARVGSWSGGAICNQGSLSLNGVTVQNNIAKAPDGRRHHPESVAMLTSSARRADGGEVPAAATRHSSRDISHPGGGWGSGRRGRALRGRGTASLTNVTLSSNTAQGGQGGKGCYWEQRRQAKMWWLRWRRSRGRDVRGLGARRRAPLLHRDRQQCDGRPGRGPAAPMASGKAAACTSSPGLRLPRRLHGGPRHQQQGLQPNPNIYGSYTTCP